MLVQMFDSDGKLLLKMNCSTDAEARRIVKETSFRSDIIRWVLRDDIGERANWLRRDAGPINITQSYRYTEKEN